MNLKQSNLSRRQMLKLMGTSAAGLALAACAAPAAPQAGGEAAAPGQEAVVVQFDAGGFTPSKYTGQQLQEGQADLVAFDVVANAYKEVKPNVTIEFQPVPWQPGAGHGYHVVGRHCAGYDVDAAGLCERRPGQGLVAGARPVAGNAQPLCAGRSPGAARGMRASTPVSTSGVRRTAISTCCWATRPR